MLITKALVVSGNADNGSKCGVSCAYSGNGFDNANSNNGARLNFFENVVKYLLRIEVKICALPFSGIVKVIKMKIR